MNFRLLPFLAVLTLADAACAGRRPPQPAIVEDALAYAESDRTKAIRLLEDAIQTGDTGEDDLPWVMLHTAEQHRLAGNTDDARTWFTKVLSDTSKNKALDGARLGLALLDSADSGSKKKLTDISDKFVPATINADRYLLLALGAVEVNDASAVRDYTKRAMQFAKEDPAVEARIESTLRAARGGTVDAPPDDKPTDPPPADTAEPLSVLDQARLAWQQGREQEARVLVGKASEDEALAGGAAALLQMIDSGHGINANSIGLLLPLEGKYAAAGKQVQASFELGYAAAGSKRRLLFVDSGSTAETAVAALEKMVLEDGVIAVVGPLLTPETDAVVTRAEELGVPLISLSQALAHDAERDWTLQAMVTADAQVEALVEFTMAEKEMKSFAIFAPDNGYGHRSAEAFRRSVEKREGTIAAEKFYDPTSTNLGPFAKELTFKDYEERWREFKDLKEEAEENGGNPDTVVLPPIINFEGLFIPDNARRVPLAAAALAVEEYPMGEFVPIKDAPTVTLLGLSGWNSTDIVGAGGEPTRGSFFVDSFAEYDTASINFADNFRATIGHSPNSLEAVSVDAGQLVAAAAMSDAKTWFEFRDALLAVDLQQSGTGTSGFDAETLAADRVFRILSIDREKIFQVQPEPVIIVPDPCAALEDGTLPQGCEPTPDEGAAPE